MESYSDKSNFRFPIEIIQVDCFNKTDNVQLLVIQTILISKSKYIFINIKYERVLNQEVEKFVDIYLSKLTGKTNRVSGVDSESSSIRRLGWVVGLVGWLLKPPM